MDDDLNINVTPLETINVSVTSLETINVSVTPEPVVSLKLDLNSYHASSVPSYYFQTLTPLSTWTINHNLGYMPTVQLFNSGSQMIMGNITQVSNTQTVVHFSQPTSGFARLI